MLPMMMMMMTMMMLTMISAENDDNFVEFGRFFVAQLGGYNGKFWTLQ